MGMRPFIWGLQADLMELADALHCGLLGLESIDND
jgi:hypothetical protein